ncbi:MAG: SDR family oxidoreductase [Catenulispora sp.]|nr:SDR family oxidoreductase [Catenulispora sp.]
MDTGARRGLRGRTALVTGAAGGLGTAITRMLVSEGVKVWAADVKASSLETLQEALAADPPDGSGSVRPLELDVRDPGNIADAVAGVIEEDGRLDVLVNNAAVDVTLPVPKLSAADADLVIGTDLLGPIYLCLETFPRMAAQGEGYIVNILSTAALQTWTEAGLYSAAKHGLRAFTHTLFQEARRDCPAVGITGVVAGGMRTPFITERFPDADVSMLQDPSVVADAIRFVLTQPVRSLVPEIVVVPHQEPTWP